MPKHNRRSQVRLTILALIISGLLQTGPSAVAFAGTRDKAGNSADVVAISIDPALATIGTYPDITAEVLNSSTVYNGSQGKATFDIVVMITYPDGQNKRLVWDNIDFAANQKKTFAMPRNFDNTKDGSYTVTFTVYNSARSYSHAQLAKTFTLSQPELFDQDRVKLPASSDAQARSLQSSGETSHRARSAKTTLSGDTRRIGIGLHVNALNFSAGPSFVIWPADAVALQLFYGIGTFTSYEARTFYRLQMSRTLSPYFGAGFVHAERKATVLGTDTVIPGDSFTAFGGVESRIARNLYAYADVSASPMKIKKDVTSGTTQATVTVTYAPVTINTGLVWYFY